MYWRLGRKTAVYIGEENSGTKIFGTGLACSPGCSTNSGIIRWICSSIKLYRIVILYGPMFACGEHLSPSYSIPFPSLCKAVTYIIDWTLDTTGLYYTVKVITINCEDMFRVLSRLSWYTSLIKRSALLRFLKCSPSPFFFSSF